MGVVVLGIVVESQAVWGCVQGTVLRVARPGSGPRLKKRSSLRVAKPAAGPRQGSKSGVTNEVATEYKSPAQRIPVY